ncbi:hypothetical protein V6Z12_D04G050900 [Gossypium hirsutum]
MDHSHGLHDAHNPNNVSIQNCGKQQCLLKSVLQTGDSVKTIFLLSNLFNKRISFTMFCPKCSIILETITHVVRDCIMVAAVWQSLNISWPAIHNNTDVIDWLSFLFNKHSTIIVNLILIAIQAL